MYLIKLYDFLSIDGSNGLTLCVRFKVEDYYEIIEEPMDFGTMRANLHEGLYTSLEQFEVFHKVTRFDQPNKPTTHLSTFMFMIFSFFPLI